MSQWHGGRLGYTRKKLKVQTIKIKLNFCWETVCQLSITAASKILDTKNNKEGIYVRHVSYKRKKLEKARFLFQILTRNVFF